MSRNYCGKDCGDCGYLSRGKCEGCAAVWRECEIANCCREKGHVDCTTCGFQGSCLKLNKKDRAPESRAQAREWERKKQEAKAAREAELARRAPILGKWLWVLFCLSMVSLAGSIFTTDTMVNWFPALRRPGEIVEALCSLVYGVVLLCLSSLDRRYRTAGVCAIAAMALTAAANILFENSLDGKLLLLIPGLIIALVSEYQEYTAHANVTAELDYALSEKWRKLWTWYLLTMGALLLGTLLTVIVIGMFLILAASIALIVVGVLGLIYLYRTAKLFREYPVRQI